MATVGENSVNSAIFYIGHDELQRSQPVINETLELAQRRGYDTVTAPITNRNYRRRVVSELVGFLRPSNDYDDFAEVKESRVATTPAIRPLDPQDTDLTPDTFTSRCLLTTATWVDLASPDRLVAAVSKDVLLQEIQYATFCCGVNIIIPGPRLRRGHLHRDGVARYAHAIREAFELGQNLHFQILLPMSFQGEQNEASDAVDLALSADDKRITGSSDVWDPSSEIMSSWEVWDTIRTLCSYNPRLSIALNLPRHLPPLEVQSRWFAEPLRILRLPNTSFVSKKNGYEGLDSSQQRLLSRFMKLRNAPWILLSDVETLSTQYAPSTAPIEEENPTPAEASQSPSKPKSQRRHVDYIRHFLQTRQPNKSFTEREGTGYEDFLQNPLQPLAQHLESMTYETFERCPVKYELYEQAIANALKDWKAMSKSTSSLDGRVVVAVLGAGRGPLVTRALEASRKSGVLIELWAVEKNPSAFLILQRQNQKVWQNRVHLVRSDMRSWSGPNLPIQSDRQSDMSNGATPSTSDMKVDIIVSELLGSFGDNELSPECIDGAQHLLNPQYGISIPQAYSAHLTPIAAPKLHTDIASRGAQDGPNAWEIPWVVMLQAFDYLSVRRSSRDSTNDRESQPPTRNHPYGHCVEPLIKQAWGFRHPTTADLDAQKPQGSNSHNTRFARLEFTCATRGVCHGLAGYFEAVLYAGKTNLGNENPGSQAESSISQSNEQQNEKTGDQSDRIEISTNPLNMESRCKDMISWFPMFFPLRVPLHLPDNSELHVSIWRRTDSRKIWYEWMVESFLVVNRGGGSTQPRLIKLGTSELHSSVKDGCLM